MRGAKVAVRVFSVLVSLVVAFVLFAGVYSLVTRESLILGLAGLPESDIQRLDMTNEERMKAAALTIGPFALDEDPRVGFRMKGRVTREFVGVPAATDEYGQRIRPGPKPEEGATRIVILGDSVAFGFGVRDRETMGHHLEELLAGTMAPDQRRPVVMTVACPGWNWWNQARYLKNHLARLDPDIVLHVPIDNDLDDSHTITESGHRNLEFDPRWGATRPRCSLETFLWFRQTFRAKLPVPLLLRIAANGRERAVPYVMYSDVSPTSQRRWDSAVAGMNALRTRLASRSCRFAVAFMYASDPQRVLEHRLHRACPDLDVLPVFGERDKIDFLGHDPHPNPRCTRAMAWRLAEHLIARDWVPGAGYRSLPAEDTGFSGRRMEVGNPQDLAVWHDQHTERWYRFIEPLVDLENGTGFHQIYGGLRVDGVLGRLALIAIRGGGTTLRVTITRPPSTSPLYPFSIETTINGIPMPSYPIPAPSGRGSEQLTLSIPVPAAVRSARVLDVMLGPTESRASLIEGMRRLQSVLLRRIVCE
ncbi:MAG: hypothetical protein CMJ83_17505 [Planctomycetes bacterium]|nr:hypothetical protein [Planctomycetota bacterium]